MGPINIRILQSDFKAPGRGDSRKRRILMLLMFTYHTRCTFPTYFSYTGYYIYQAIYSAYTINHMQYTIHSILFSLYQARIHIMAFEPLFMQFPASVSPKKLPQAGPSASVLPSWRLGCHPHVLAGAAPFWNCHVMGSA